MVKRAYLYTLNKAYRCMKDLEGTIREIAELAWAAFLFLFYIAGTVVVAAFFVNSIKYVMALMPF